MSVIKPVISKISPTSGPAGSKVTITGKGFVDGNNIHGVFFNDVPTHNWADPDGGPSFVGWKVLNDTTIEALVPEGHEGQPPLTGTVQITVRTEGGIENFGKGVETSNPASFTYAA